MHEPPFVVFRDHEAGTVTVVPLDELLQMRRVALEQAFKASQNDPEARKILEEIASAVSRGPSPHRGRPVLSAYLVRDALTDIAAWRDQMRAQSAPAPGPAPGPAQGPVQGPAPVDGEEKRRPAVVGLCPHGIPDDLLCTDCGAKEKVA